MTGRESPRETVPAPRPWIPGCWKPLEEGLTPGLQTVPLGDAMRGGLEPVLPSCLLAAPGW